MEISPAYKILFFQADHCSKIFNGGFFQGRVNPPAGLQMGFGNVWASKTLQLLQHITPPLGWLADSQTDVLATA